MTTASTWPTTAEPEPAGAVEPSSSDGVGVTPYPPCPLPDRPSAGSVGRKAPEYVRGPRWGLGAGLEPAERLAGADLATAEADAVAACLLAAEDPSAVLRAWLAGCDVLAVRHG